jgi:hypothetical protein
MVWFRRESLLEPLRPALVVYLASAYRCKYNISTDLTEACQEGGEPTRSELHKLYHPDDNSCMCDRDSIHRSGLSCKVVSFLFTKTSMKETTFYDMPRMLCAPASGQFELVAPSGGTGACQGSRQCEFRRPTQA